MAIDFLKKLLRTATLAPAAAAAPATAAAAPAAAAAATPPPAGSLDVDATTVSSTETKLIFALPGAACELPVERRARNMYKLSPAALARKSASAADLSELDSVHGGPPCLSDGSSNSASERSSSSSTSSSCPASPQLSALSAPIAIAVDEQPIELEHLSRPVVIRLLWSAVARGNLTFASVSAASAPSRAGSRAASSISSRRISFSHYQGFHHALSRATCTAAEWSLEEANTLCRANWRVDAGPGQCATMSRESFERSIESLSNHYAQHIAGCEAGVAVRLLAVDAGLGDDVPLAFLLNLLDAITTGPAPWPSNRTSSDSSPASPRGSGASVPHMRHWEDVPLGCATPQALFRSLAAHEMPRQRSPAAGRPRPAGPRRRAAALPRGAGPARPGYPEADEASCEALGASMGLRRAALQQRLSQLLAERAPPTAAAAPLPAAGAGGPAHCPPLPPLELGSQRPSAGPDPLEQIRSLLALRLAP